MTRPYLAAPVPSADSLILYDANGYRVAFCDEKFDDDHNPILAHCKLGEGYTLNDVMTAWPHAYEDR